MKEPKTVVRQIYDHFGYDFTAEFEARIDAFMAHNPRYKHGKPDYSLEEFGLDAQELKERFARFDPAQRRPATPAQQSAKAGNSQEESPPGSPPSSSDGDRESGQAMRQPVTSRRQGQPVAPGSSMP